jgi:hypothetical protein
MDFLGWLATPFEDLPGLIAGSGPCCDKAEYSTVRGGQIESEHQGHSWANQTLAQVFTKNSEHLPQKDQSRVLAIRFAEALTLTSQA